MGIFQNINAFRRRVMNGLTKNIGKSNKYKDIHENEIKKVLICRPNQRLGNLLLTTPLIQEVIDTFPMCQIDIIVKGGLAPILYQNYKNITNIKQLPRKPFKEIFKYIWVFTSVSRKRYDLVINPVEGSSSGKILTRIANAKYKIYGVPSENTIATYLDHMHMAKSGVYALRERLSDGSKDNTKSYMPVIDIKLSKKEMADGLKTLKGIVKNDKKTICIFTFATGAKCYSEEWWEAFYASLKKEYQEYNIVEVLPMENVSQIGFDAPSFYSRDLRLIAAFIANTEIFIGADSGMMHLAAASGKPTVGLFHVTNEAVYQPYGNHSTYINTNSMSNEESIILLNTILSKS